MSSKPTDLFGIGKKPAATVRHDTLVSIKFANTRLDNICCGVVPDGLFPGHLVMGKSLFHKLGVYTNPEGKINLLNVKNKPELIPIRTRAFATKAAPHTSEISRLTTTWLMRLKSKYPALFGLNGVFKPITNVSHSIETDCRPIKLPVRRYSPAQLRIITEFLDSVTSKGLVRKSKSPWASPAMVVPKKDGRWRLVIDYRALNDHTKKHAFPLPNIQDELRRAGGHKYYCSFDLQDGFWHIPIAENSIEKTAFTVPQGLFEWLVMPFGLTNAPATFQSFMTEVLEPLRLQEIVSGTLDDVCTWGETVQECITNSEKILARFASYGLTLNFRKCKWLQEEIVFLGFIVNSAGTKVDPTKVEAILARPLPTTATEVRSFINAARYLQHFIPGFAGIAAPLYSLTG